MALVCLLRYCQLSEFRRMAASEAATLDSSRQDVGIAECDSNSAAPHPASSNAALFVLTIFSSIYICSSILLFNLSVKTEETIYYFEFFYHFQTTSA
ncbi:hypothetical protein T12_15369 [Trichinella patagoniensis]|uniref:Uncharacterized protein n=1 Tax=Trichinella patagoniensis TaxID=990121 RepID=A0A0V1AA04_9BILA|nr:hypothetical protein T12_15369 [Trichinella patagoniensis]